MICNIPGAYINIHLVDKKKVHRFDDITDLESYFDYSIHRYCQHFYFQFFGTEYIPLEL